MAKKKIPKRRKKRPAAKPRRSLARQKQSANLTLFDNPSGRLEYALQILRSGDQEKAMKLFDAALRHEPENIRAYIMAARANAECFRFDRMSSIIEKLVRAAPEHPGVYHYLGQLYSQIRYPNQAHAAFEKALRLPGVLPETWLEMASVYERSHRLEEAWDLVERASATGLKMPQLPIIAARLKRRMGEHASAETILFEFVQSQSETSEWTAQAWGDIAILRDSLEDYDGAWEAILNCKLAQRSKAEEYRRSTAKVQGQLSQMIEDLTEQDFSDWQQESSGLPQRKVSLLTGFPRSGTTLLEQVLDAHPQLISSEERDYLGTAVFRRVAGQSHAEPVLRNCLVALSKQQICDERERYFEVMESILGERIGNRMLLDKNPAYNLSIPLLLRILPEARLLVALRDPRDVVLSCFLRYLPINTISASFQSLSSTATRFRFDMTAWLRLRDRIPGHWKEVRYEDTVGNLEQQARETLPVLGLDWHESVLNYRQRLTKNKRVNSPTYEAVSQPIHSRAIGRWKNYERHFGPAIETLQPVIDALGY